MDFTSFPGNFVNQITPETSTNSPLIFYNTRTIQQRENFILRLAKSCVYFSKTEFKQLNLLCLDFSKPILS